METIAIIGIGRLGLCLALNLERAGYHVIGLDVNTGYVNDINSKVINSLEPFVNDYLNSSRNLKATTNAEEILDENIQLIFIVVPTPSLPDGTFDHHHVDDAVNALVKHGRQQTQKHLIINSTTIPGYCDALHERIHYLNYTVSYNPEFIAQGSIIENQQYPDQVLIGEATEEAGDLIENIYKKLCKNTPVFCRMKRVSAEITKLATNCFLTTKISFANAIGDLAIKANAEPEKILQAIGSDSRIGNKYFKYGFGYGGPCFPRDNKAFTTFASNQNYNMLISEATDRANAVHSDFLFDTWTQEYETDEYIVFDSVTYKKGTDILEASQQLKLAVALAQSGKKVKIKESAAVIKKLIDLYNNLFIYEVNGN